MAWPGAQPFPGDPWDEEPFEPPLPPVFEALANLRGDRLRNVLQVEEDASQQQVTLLLVVSDSGERPSIRVMALDFMAKTFKLSLPIPLVQRRQMCAHPPPILRTADAHRFVVVLPAWGGVLAFVFDLARSRVEAIHGGRELVWPGLINLQAAGFHPVGFQLFGNQLVCVGQHPESARATSADSHTVRVALFDLASGERTDVSTERSLFYEQRSQIKSVCMRDEFVYALAKNPNTSAPMRVFRLQLPHGKWEAVQAVHFGGFEFAAPTCCFHQGIWTVHCRRTTTVGFRSLQEFYSYRIPIARPETLAHRAWFSVLSRPNFDLDVPQTGACRLLSRTGLFLNKVAFVHQQTILIREDLDPFEVLRQQGCKLTSAVFSRSGGFATSGEESEDADFQTAIALSLQWFREHTIETTADEPLGVQEQLEVATAEAAEVKIEPEAIEQPNETALQDVDYSDVEEEGEVTFDATDGEEQPEAEQNAGGGDTWDEVEAVPEVRELADSPAKRQRLDEQ
ncbi:hypothetical protein M3Y99_00540000 [Aphelenchoides fujianensis]|nr:hypothetical protein M3Y99_00540000 [Aphelenchoides fujianensis]